MRFDPSVRAALDVIWNVTDTNGDGMIEKDEYIAMSTKLYRVIVGTKLRRAGGGTIALEEAERARIEALDKAEEERKAQEGNVNK